MKGCAIAAALLKEKKSNGTRDLMEATLENALLVAMVSVAAMQSQTGLHLHLILINSPPNWAITILQLTF